MVIRANPATPVSCTPPIRSVPPWVLQGARRPAGSADLRVGQAVRPLLAQGRKAQRPPPPQQLTSSNEHPAHHRHPWLLRARRERPRACRAAEQRDEVAPLHSITSSAVASSLSGTVRPSVLAVLRLITRSNLVGCSIGRSPGLAPLKILSMYHAARRKTQFRLAP